MSPESPLPPPIRDPSGKIYIAIPAPPFVLAQDATVSSQNVNCAPGYIYIEYSSGGPHEIPQDVMLPGRPEPAEINPSNSVQRWMTTNCSAEPPPDHVPWTGHVPPSSSSATLSISTNEDFHPSKEIVNAGCSVLGSSSATTLELPTTDSGNTLLNGSLPSTCSSGWSGGIVAPPISEAKAAAKAPRVTSIPALKTRTSGSLAKARDAADRRRYTVCATATSKRREGQIFNRRRTLEKTQPIQLCLSKTQRHISKAKIMSRIDELDGFFSEGLKKVDSTMQRFNEDQDKFSTPSLVVSTSTAINPVSLDSFDDLTVPNPSLAERRGKAVPGTLKLANCSGLVSAAIDYPDVPTAFRVSPEPTPDVISEPPTYPELRLDPKMTTEQMITSLREQVESFFPRCRDSGKISNAFDTQCEDAWNWLENELKHNSSEDTPMSGEHPLSRPLKVNHLNSPESFSDDESISSVSHKFPQPPTETKGSDHVKEAQPSPTGFRGRALSLHASVLRLSTSSSRSRASEPQTPKMKPRRSILSTGSASSSSSSKKVRFSDTPPSIIPPIKGISKPNESPSTIPTPTKRSPLSPLKRKPVPDFNPPGTRSSIPLTPVKLSTVRKSSPLNPATQSRIAMPSARFAAKHGEGPVLASSIPVVTTPTRKGPLIFNSGNTPKNRESADGMSVRKKISRPLSLGANLKENRDRSFGDKLASIAKRRSYSAGISSADKENRRESKIVELVVKEAQKKGPKRGLPFLSRWRG